MRGDKQRSQQFPVADAARPVLSGIHHAEE